MRQETRKIERTAAEKARLRAIRDRFQREKPTLQQLHASGEYGPPIPNSAYFAVAALVKQLREARELAGFSLADLAEKTGMDKAAICRLETGKHGNPTIDTLARYAAAVGKGLQLTLTADVPPSPPQPSAKPQSTKTPAGSKSSPRASPSGA